MGLVRRNSQAAPAVERRDAPRDHAGLIAALRNGSADARRWAALDLAGDADAVAPLAALLAGEPDQAVREAALNTLAGIGGPSVVEALLPYLRYEDAAIRNAVVECLSKVPDSLDAVPQLLADRDPDVRVLTVTLVASLHDPRVPGLLAGVVTGDPDPNVCGCAIGELAELAGASAQDVIEAAAERFPDDPFVAFTARTFATRASDGK